MHRIVRIICLALAIVWVFSATASAQYYHYWYKDGWQWTPGPNGSEVGGCMGNCGAGCAQKNDGNCTPSSVLGSGNLGWRMYYLSDIEITASNTYEECVYEGDSLLRRYIVSWEESTVLAKYEYTGWVRTGCITHDAMCPEYLWVGCAFFTGCGSTIGYDTWEYQKWVTGFRETERYPSGWCGE